MKCENCGASLRPDLERGIYACDYCRSEFVPPPESDGVLVLADTRHSCPICNHHLFEASLETFPLEYCAHCHGMLVAMDRFIDLVEALRIRGDRFSRHIERRSSVDADRYLRCPGCGSRMDGHPYGGGGNVNVDSCEKCDVLWLDGGELRRIAGSPDHTARLTRY